MEWDAQTDASYLCDYWRPADAADLTKGPSHYTEMDLQPVEFNRRSLSWEGYLGWCLGCANKYGMRQGRKAGTDDGPKGRWFLDEWRRVKDIGPDGDWRDAA
jgi:hypothetical protein